MKEQLREIIVQTFEQCRAEGLLRSETLPNFTVELPRSEKHGDLATNIAMLLAKQEKVLDMSARDQLQTAWEYLSGENERTPKARLPKTNVDMSFFLNSSPNHLSATWLVAK